LLRLSVSAQRLVVETYRTCVHHLEDDFHCLLECHVYIF